MSELQSSILDEEDFDRKHEADFEQPQTAEDDEIVPEVCVYCGTYFNYTGGRQVCGRCARL